MPMTIPRTVMDLEGLRTWMPARLTGFTLLREAVEAFGFFDTLDEHG
jgi:hypothetical protein